MFIQTKKGKMEIHLWDFHWEMPHQSISSQDEKNYQINRRYNEN